MKRIALLAAVVLAVACSNQTKPLGRIDEIRKSIIFSPPTVKALGSDASGNLTIANDCLACSVDGANVGTTTLTVPQGGSGSVSFPANSLAIGNGTSPLQGLAPGSRYKVLTSMGTGIDPDYVSPPTAYRLQNIMSGSVVISAALGTYQVIGLPLTYTIAGTYDVIIPIRWNLSATSGFIVCKLKDITNGVFESASETLIAQNQPNIGNTTTMNYILDVVAPPITVELWCKRDGSGTVTATIIGDANGYTAHNAKLLSYF